VTPRAPGGEAELLEELERLGLVCEPATQLVCVCEVRANACCDGVVATASR
jgi:L-serine deaminase